MSLEGRAAAAARGIAALKAECGYTDEGNVDALVRYAAALEECYRELLSSSQEIFVVRPSDPAEDVAAFEDEDDAEAFAATYDDIGPVERVTVCDRQAAKTLIASRCDVDGFDAEAASEQLG